MEGRCPLCRPLVLVPALLAVSLAGTLGGCALVQRDVDASSRAALGAAGVGGVSVDASYRTVHLRGPAASRDRALAAVAGLDAVRDADYTATGAAAAAASINAQLVGNRIVLSGTVANADERARLVTAARSAVGAANVTDRLVVAGTVPTDAQDGAVDILVSVVGGLPKDLTAAQVTLRDRVLRVTGQLRAADIATLQTALDRARGAGLTVQTAFRPSPAAAARPGAVQRRLTGVLEGTTIQFDTGSADIRAVSRPILDRATAIMVPAMRANAGLRVRVEGHTDNVGDATRNVQLSQRRADAVVRYLVARGVPRARLSAVGFGSAKPVADNTTEAGRLANRRIAFRVVGG